MTEEELPKPRRRPRYAGKNPRHFHEKYKEHQPDRYPGETAKTIDRGQTPAGTHRPIMMREILEVLAPRPGAIVVDCTLGFGGHARGLLSAIQPGGRLLGIDADPIELARTEARLRMLGFGPEILTVRRMNFAGARPLIAELFPEGADLILADLGTSSMQLDDPARGFAFKEEGPLDMRMNPTRGQTARDLLSRLDHTRLAKLFVDNADLATAQALALARAIKIVHATRPITTTQSLAAVAHEFLIGRSRSPIGSADDPVRRIFQALRMAVNDELESLAALLKSLRYCLRPGGRVAILSFHSGEDRLVKAAFKAGLHDGTYASIATDVVRAGPTEVRDNPRARSAKLRYATRTA
jgi:16S rRNA (cytosine1402-N4)-methyltransferase